MNTTPEQRRYLQYLEKSALFHGLEPAALTEVARVARLRRVSSGAFFFYEGDPARVLYVLTEGRVKFTQITPEGHQVLLRVIGPGEMFGAVAALGDAFHPATGEAQSMCAALGWGSDVIGDLMERFPPIALNAIRFLVGRLHEFQDRCRELATERVERRVAHALLRLSQQIGRTVEGGTLLDLTLSRQDIAEMTGTTLFTVSRILSDWEAQGLVEGGRSRVLIRKPERLLAIAEDLPPAVGRG